MSLHSPVVFTDDPALTSEARARRWPVVSRDGATLRMSGVRQSAPLPEPNMDITAGSLTGESAGGWKFVRCKLRIPKNVITGDTRRVLTSVVKRETTQTANAHFTL